jgi:hypothetical protein
LLAARGAVAFVARHEERRTVRATLGRDEEHPFRADWERARSDAEVVDEDGARRVGHIEHEDAGGPFHGNERAGAAVGRPDGEPFGFRPFVLGTSVDPCADVVDGGVGLEETVRIVHERAGFRVPDRETARADRGRAIDVAVDAGESEALVAVYACPAAEGGIVADARVNVAT